MRRTGSCYCYKIRCARTWIRNVARERSGAACIGYGMSGNDLAMCWHRIHSKRKKRQIRRVLGNLAERSVVLVEDETALSLFAPLCAMWSPRGVSAPVTLSGGNARRVVFGCMNVLTGHRLFLLRRPQRTQDFHAFLYLVRRHYRGWQVTMVLDNHKSHACQASLALADSLGMRPLWLPKRALELNPMDTLWGTRQGCDLR